MNKRIHISKRIGAIFLCLALLCGIIVSTGAFPVTVTADADAMVQKFTADFSTLTAGAVSAKADVEYLTSKFNFWYAQEAGFLFQRPNVNDFWLTKDADGNFAEMAENSINTNTATAYRPDTFEAVTVTKWADYIGTSSGGRGKSVWTVTDGMLSCDANYKESEKYRRFNQMAVLDSNGEAASLKNFELSMEFKLLNTSNYDTGLLSVAFRAQSEAINGVNKNATGTVAGDRTFVALSPKSGRYFIGDPANAEAYTNHLKMDDKASSSTTLSSALAINTTYTMKLRVVGENIEMSIYDAEGNAVADTVTATTTWDKEGYLVLGSSCNGAAFANVVVTRLDDNGNAVDFTPAATPDPEPGTTVKTFKADFTALTAGAVSANKDVEYLTEKFRFYYEQEGTYFRRPNVNDYYVDADGNPITTVQNPDITVYDPYTGADMGSSQWKDGIGSGASSRGIATWSVTGDGMLYVANSSSGSEYFRRYNQMVVLASNSAPASLKNFKLTMDFRLSGDGLSLMTVAFRAKNEVGTVKSNGSSADRALLSLNTNGYFVGGPNDTYASNPYANHFHQDQWADVNNFATALNTTTTYTLELRVVNNEITATIYNGSLEVAVIQKETAWTDAGYITIGGSNAGGCYGNVEITRLDNEGNAIDFDSVGEAEDCPWDTTVDSFSQSMNTTAEELERLYDFYYSAKVNGTPTTVTEELSAHWALNDSDILMRQNDLGGNATEKVAMIRYNPDEADVKLANFDATFKLSFDENESGTFWLTGRQTDSAKRGMIVATPGDTDYVPGQVAVGFAVGGVLTVADGTADPVVIDGTNAGTPTGTYTLRVRLYGNKIEVYVNGEQKVSRTLENTAAEEGYLTFGYSGAALGIGNVNIVRLDDLGVAVDLTTQYVSVKNPDLIFVKPDTDVQTVIDQLPATVTVTDVNEDTVSMNVYWDPDSIDLSVEGTQYIVGYLEDTNGIRAAATVMVGAYDPDITTLYNFDDESQLNDFESWYMPATTATDLPAIHTEGTADDTWYIGNGKLSFKENSLYMDKETLKAGKEINGVLYQDDVGHNAYTGNFGIAVLKTRTYENFILEVDIKSNTRWSVVGFGAEDYADPLSVFSTQTNGGYSFRVESGSGKGQARIWGRRPGDEASTAFAAQTMDPYVIDGSTHHYRIVVSDGVAYFYLDDIDMPFKVELPDTYEGGYIYLAVNMADGGFDNLKITDLDEKLINITNVLSSFTPVEIDRKAGDTLSLPSTVLTEDENGYEYALPAEWLNSVYRSYLDGEFTFDAVLQPYHNMTIAEGLTTQFKAVNRINGAFDSEKSVKYYFDHPNDFLDFYSQYSEENYNGKVGYHSGFDGDLVTIDADERWAISDGRATPSYTYVSGAWNGSGFTKGISSLVLKDLNLMNFRVEMDYTHGTDSWYPYLLVGVQNPNKMYGEVYWGSGSATYTNPFPPVTTDFYPKWGGGAWVHMEQEGYINIRGGVDGNTARFSNDYAGDFMATYDRNAQHHIVVEVVNSMISIQVDDSDIYYTDLSNYTLGGYVGFATHGNGATYDNFQVTALDTFGNEVPLSEAKKGMAPTTEPDYIGWQPDRKKWEFEWGPEYEQ